jgi:hypothetical protein
MPVLTRPTKTNDTGHLAASQALIDRYNAMRWSSDYASIQAAIDSLPANGGSVYIPAGIHYLTAPLMLRFGVRLCGDGYRTSILINNGNDDAVRSTSDNDGSKQIILENLTIADGRKSTRTSGHGLHIGSESGAAQVMIRNLLVTGHIDGLNMKPSFTTASHIDGLIVNGAIRNGVAVETHSTAVSFQNCSCSACGSHGFAFRGVYSSFINCAADGNTLDGYHLWYTRPYAPSSYIRCVSLISCGAEVNGRYGLFAERADHLSLITFVAHNPAVGGVYLEGCKTVSMDNCMNGRNNDQAVTEYGLSLTTHAEDNTPCERVYLRGCDWDGVTGDIYDPDEAIVQNI